MTPQERLAAEEFPTGTFGHALPPRPAPPRARHTRTWTAPTWTPEEQAAHVAELEAELDRLEGRGTGKPKLQVIDGEVA